MDPPELRLDPGRCPSLSSLKATTSQSRTMDLLIKKAQISSLGVFVAEARIPLLSCVATDTPGSHDFEFDLDGRELHPVANSRSPQRNGKSETGRRKTNSMTSSGKEDVNFCLKIHSHKYRSTFETLSCRSVGTCMHACPSLVQFPYKEVPYPYLERSDLQLPDLPGTIVMSPLLKIIHDSAQRGQVRGSFRAKETTKMVERWEKR